MFGMLNLWLPQLTFITMAVADPGFPVGGYGLLRRLRFENFVCQNERIQALRGSECQVHPLDLPMNGSSASI